MVDCRDRLETPEQKARWKRIEEHGKALEREAAQYQNH